MARAGLKDHPKFKRLVFVMQEPAPHVQGYLEFLWTTAYQLRSDQIGDAIDVELNAEYPGEQGKLAKALLDCRWIDLKSDGKYYVHDLIDHCPQYVKKVLLKKMSDQQLTTSQPLDNQRLTNGQPMDNQRSENSDQHLTIGSQLKRREEKEEEKKKPNGVPPGVFLAQEFRFKQTGRKEDEFVLTAMFESMLTFGYEYDAMLAEIRKPPTPEGRDYSERSFKLKDRLEKQRQTATTSKPARDPTAERNAMLGRRPTTTEKPP